MALPRQSTACATVLLLVALTVVNAVDAVAPCSTSGLNLGSIPSCIKNLAFNQAGNDALNCTVDICCYCNQEAFLASLPSLFGACTPVEQEAGISFMKAACPSFQLPDSKPGSQTTTISSTAANDARSRGDVATSSMHSPTSLDGTRTSKSQGATVASVVSNILSLPVPSFNSIENSGARSRSNNATSSMHSSTLLDGTRILKSHGATVSSVVSNISSSPVPSITSIENSGIPSTSSNLSSAAFRVRLNIPYTYASFFSLGCVLRIIAW